MDYIIRLETPQDESYVENLTRESFWNVYRPGCSEHCVLRRLRKDPSFIPELNFVLEYDGHIIAHVIFVEYELVLNSGGREKVLSFGPLTVNPGCHHRGVGSYLLRYALDKAKSMGYKSCFVLGNPRFYGTIGFKHAKEYGICFQDMDENFTHFQAMEFEEGALKGKEGRVYIPKAYYPTDEEVEEFDKQFPPKEKLKLPGQL